LPILRFTDAETGEETDWEHPTVRTKESRVGDTMTKKVFVTNTWHLPIQINSVTPSNNNLRLAKPFPTTMDRGETVEIELIYDVPADSKEEPIADLDIDYEYPTVG
jgi:hypothetical protein